MGFKVERIGSANRPDGGIDIIAWPPKTEFPYLIAVQAKHHRDMSLKTGVRTVRDLRGTISNIPVDIGVVVTNTTFTANARWVANQYPRIIRLRDISDLARWLLKDYLQDKDLKAFPEKIKIAPGVSISIPLEPLI